MALKLKVLLLELGRWMFLGPLYAASVAMSIFLILGFPMMTDLLFDPKHASGGVSHAIETLYIWTGIALIAVGYVMLLAAAPATLTGVAKVLIDRVVIPPRPRRYLIYGCAALASTLASFYFLFSERGFFSLDTSFWGRPAYSWLVIFIEMGLVCCWLMLRTKRAIAKSR